MKCINENCDATEIEKDDNFCYKCGHWTGKGHSLINNKEEFKKLANGPAMRQSNRLTSLFLLLILSVIIFVIIVNIRGNSLFKPYYYLKKQAFNYIYGYNTSLIKTDNKYDNIAVNSYDEGINLIKKDFTEQNYYCFNDYDALKLTLEIEKNHNIPSVSFCDLDYEEAKKIKNVIDKIYILFPNIEGSLTNISMTNATKDKNYIARFQPVYQFININNDINEYNKVNKTQVLLNSYYFLNKDILKDNIEKTVGEKWYVKDATWESTIAHELGHYISFLTLLKKYNIPNVTFVTKDNEEIINEVMSNFNKGIYSTELVNNALNNYNNKYGENITIYEFASKISNYASSKDENDLLIADETIAEAIHDYFLHGDNMNLCSQEIINIVKLELMR